MSGPLDGVKIVDLSAVVLGPFATQILADLGADVLKVETPEGDTLRTIGPARSTGMAANFMAMNRNKRSIAIDLRKPEGLQTIRRLTAKADVFFTNTRAASLEEMGLGAEQLRAVNPRLIYCRGSGFGENGRYAGKPAFDDLIQGAVALPALVQRASGGEPHYLPTNICDRVTGITAANAILAALYARERTGLGQSVEVPMFETMTQFVMSDHLYGASFDPPIGEPGYARLLVKGRAPFKTRDGYISAMVYLDKHWAKFCAMVGRPELADDPRFCSLQKRTANATEVLGFVAEQFAGRTSAEWLALFTDADMPVMPVHDLHTILEDPHLADVGFFQWVEHPTEGRVRSMGIPVSFSGTPAESRLPAPHVGQDTEQILRESGFSAEEIERLRATGAVAGSPSSARG